MKQGWVTKTIDQISLNLDHKRVPITKSDRVTGPFPYYGASGIVDYVADYIFDFDALLVSEDGANLLARSSPIAFAATGRYWVNNHAHILRFEDPSTQRYVELFLESIRLEQYITGAAQPKLNQRALNSIPIPVAPLAEQRLIVAILDEAFEGIATAKANAEKNLRSARELFEAHHQSVFTAADDVVASKRLGDIATFRNGVNYTKQSRGHTVPIIGVKDFQNHFWVPIDDLDSVTLDGGLSAADTVVRGDILTVRSNGNPELIGRCMVVGEVDEPIAHSGFTIRIKLNCPDALPTYVCQFLRCRAVRRELIDGGNGASIKSLNQGMLAEIVIPLPTVARQHEVIAAIDAMSAETTRLADVVSRKIAALDELKKSLLHQAFSGQLTSTKRTSVALTFGLQMHSPEFSANVVALAYVRHERQRREKTFGRVKEQKTLHLVEAIGRIDLGRQPMRDAAGPNDFQHMLRAEDWARTHNFFEMVKRDGGYDFKKLSEFHEHLARAREALKPYLPELERVIDLLVPMDKEDAEVFATVHAAWNNLVIDGGDVTDGAIVAAAREDWHADKLRIPEQKFRNAIALIRQNGLVPDGTAKYVGGQQSLL